LKRKTGRTSLTMIKIKRIIQLMLGIITLLALTQIRACSLNGGLIIYDNLYNVSATYNQQKLIPALLYILNLSLSEFHSSINFNCFFEGVKKIVDYYNTKPSQVFFHYIQLYKRKTSNESRPCTSMANDS